MEQLDPTIKNLVSAIGRAETGDNKDRAYGMRGKSGEIGRYQFMPSTWKQWAKESLGDENAEMSIANQNKVAYDKVKQWKDQGLTPAQIASKWNSGGENKYKENHKGINKYGVAYDTPAYALKVSQYYNELKGQAPQTNIAQAQETTPQAPKPVEKSFADKDLLEKAGSVANVASLGVGKTTGEAIGTLGGLAYEKLKGLFGGQDNSEFYDTSAPTPLQVGADVAQGALTVGTGLGGKTVGMFGKAVPTLKTATTTAGRVGQMAGIGAGFGLTGGLKEGKTGVGELAKDTAIGGLLGGALGGAGELVSKITQYLPKRIAGSFLKGKGMGDKEMEYAIQKGLGSPSKMLAESENSISSMGKQLDDILTSKQFADFKVPGRDILNKVIQDFPEAGLTRVDVIKKLQSIVPLKKTLVTKLLKGNLTLKELHTLNSALGKNTFKTVFDGVEVKANKEIGSKMYHSISDIIKNVAPETEPLFADLSKEYPLRNTLEKLIQRGEKSKYLDLNTIIAFLSGTMAGSPLVGLGAVGAEKILTNPGVNLKTAGLLNKVGNTNIGQGLKAPVTKGLVDLTQLFGGNANVR